MPTINPDAPKLIDGYIGDAPEFARPICKKLREIIHKADEGIVEDWKWGPNFNKNGMICGFGFAKTHVHFAFFKGALLKDPRKLLVEGAGNSHSRAVHFVSASDVDEKALLPYIREATLLNERGIKAPMVRKTIATPADLKKALAGDAGARSYFDALTPGYRNEYVAWIVDAKRPETRERRIQEALAKLTRRQTLNDKYRRK